MVMSRRIKMTFRSQKSNKMLLMKSRKSRLMPKPRMLKIRVKPESQ